VQYRDERSSRIAVFLRFVPRSRDSPAQLSYAGRYFLSIAEKQLPNEAILP